MVCHGTKGWHYYPSIQHGPVVHGEQLPVLLDEARPPGGTASDRGVVLHQGPSALEAGRSRIFTKPDRAEVPSVHEGLPPDT